MVCINKYYFLNSFICFTSSVNAIINSSGSGCPSGNIKSLSSSDIVITSFDNNYSLSIELNKDQSTLLEDTADIQTVKTCTANSTKVVITELRDQVDSLKTKITDLEKLVGKMSENISSMEKQLKKTEIISEELKKKWIPILVGVPTAVQILSLTVCILWQLLQK